MSDRRDPGDALGASGDRFALLLGVDGLLCASDLPVQSFARHCSAALPVDRARALIGGMRGFLEDRPELLPPDRTLDAAEDGFDAVEIVAAHLGVAPAAIARARAAAAADLSASAWAVDPAPGLVDLLTDLRSRIPELRIWLLVHPHSDPLPAAGPLAPLLEATGLARLIGPTRCVPATAAAMSEAMSEAMSDSSAGGSARSGLPLAIASRWADLAPAAAAGWRTALVDRHRRGRGTPTWRAGDVTDLIQPVLAWADGTADVSRATAPARS